MKLIKANRIFNKVEKCGLRRTSNMFDAIIGGFFEMKDYAKGSDLLNKMRSSHVPLTEKTYAILLRYCTQKDDVEKCLNLMSQNCIKPTHEILEALIGAYVLEENDFEPGLKNSLVASYVENRWIQNALSSYHEIKQEKDTPGAMTTTKILQNVYYRSYQIYLKELSDLESSSKNYNEWDEGCMAICYFYVEYNMKQ
ncbi:pentatricopeptide repeat-containing protein [Tanacetum coccineum]